MQDPIGDMNSDCHMLHKKLKLLYSMHAMTLLKKVLC